MEAKTHRIQLALTPTAYRTLGRFKEWMGAGSVTEVIRAALATIQWLQDRVAEGFEIVIEKDGQRISVTRLLPIPLVPDADTDGQGSLEEESAGSIG
jgi:hypothetical protein